MKIDAKTLLMVTNTGRADVACGGVIVPAGKTQTCALSDVPLARLSRLQRSGLVIDAIIDGNDQKVYTVDREASKLSVSVPDSLEAPSGDGQDEVAGAAIASDTSPPSDAPSEPAGVAEEVAPAVEEPPAWPPVDDVPPAEPSAEDAARAAKVEELSNKYEQLLVAQLRALLSERGLPDEGKKVELIERIIESDLKS